MKKLLLLLFSFILIFTVPVIAEATLFNFGPISDAGGTGTATMDINILGNTLVATLNNTSQTTLDDESGVNSPGITAFGFDLTSADDDLTDLILSSWELTAYNTLGTSTSVSGDWLLAVDENISGIKVDYAFNTAGAVKGALYNPDIASGQAATPNYYTEAILTLTFNAMPILNTEDEFSPFVRMQNVGLNGEGSLKLPGIPDDDNGSGGGIPIPEPGTLILLGIALFGTALKTQKKFIK